MSDTLNDVVRTYGMTLSIGELASVLKYRNPKSILNAISAGRFPVKTEKQGNGRRIAYARDVAQYLDGLKAAS